MSFLKNKIVSFNIIMAVSDCVKETKQKYTVRNSPTYSAAKCKGTRKKGNDGKLYASKPDKNGVYKWVAVTKQTRTKKSSNNTKVTAEFLNYLVKKYKLTKFRTKKDNATRLYRLRKNQLIKSDKNILEDYLEIK